MSVLIEATTLPKTSNPFVVQRGEVVGVSAHGLGVGETVVIQRLGGGVFSNIIDASGTLTDTSYQTTIKASGTYRLVKSSTSSPAGADID